MASSISKFGFLARIRMVFRVSTLFFFASLPLYGDLNSDATPKIKKKKDAAAVSPPTALPDAASGEVNRGGETTILLRGITRGGGQVEFRLLRKPLHGKIIQTVQVRLDVLKVVYRHSGDHASKEDTFLFAVRSGGVGPFSPGTAKIRIKDLPGHLLIPELVEFPSTLAGQTASETFVAVNDGGTRLQGTLSITPPWKINEPLEYDLKPGAKKKISINFIPDRDGPFQGTLRFEGQSPIAMDLRGQGIAPFFSSVKTIKLTESGSGKRTGTVSLQNNTTGILTIEVQSDLTSPKAVTLKFGETRELTIEDEGIGMMRSFVTLISNGYQKRIEVTAEERVMEKPADSVRSEATISPAPKVVATLPTIPAIARPKTFVPVEQPEVLPAMEPAPTPTPPPPLIPAKIFVISNSAIRMEWPVRPSAKATAYTIEMRHLGWDAQDKLKIEWLPVKAKVEIQGNKGLATIDGLDSATVFTFRVAETSGDISSRLNSSPLLHRTPPGFFSRLDWRWALAFGGLAMLFMVMKKRWQERMVSW